MATVKLQINQLARQAGVPTKTIRYYESIGLLPRPERAHNNYRLYTSETIERLRFIVGARSLGFRLQEIKELLDARDKRKLVCGQTLRVLDRRLAEIDRRIADLVETRQALVALRERGKAIAPQQECDDKCLCYHITADRIHNRFTISQEEVSVA